MGLTWIDHDTIEKPIEEITLGTEEAVDIEFTVETLKSSLNEPQSASTGLPRMKPITKKVMPPLTAVTSSAAAAATVSWVQNRETARIIYEAWKTPRHRAAAEASAASYTGIMQSGVAAVSSPYWNASVKILNPMGLIQTTFFQQKIVSVSDMPFDLI